MKGKGMWIAAAVIFAMALACLFSGNFQAFGGGAILAAVFAVLAVRRSKKASRPADGPVFKEKPPAKSVSAVPCAAPSVPVQVDLSGSTGSSFGSWDISIHGADGQDMRFDRALFQHIVLRAYNPETGIAEMEGTSGQIYSTTLDACTCEDFQRRGLPGKHIYKLALSRGYSADAFFSARSDVVWYADGCRVYHISPDCRGLRNRYARRTTVVMAEYQGLRPCKSCCDD